MPNNIPTPEEILGKKNNIPTPEEILGPVKKKETTESSLEDGSSVMLEQETQKPSESSTLDKFTTKLPVSQQEKEEIFTGYPGKEKNEYRVVDGTWQRKQPGKKGWTVIKNTGSIQALNREFGKDVSTDLDVTELEKKQDRQNLDMKLNSVGDNIATLEEEDVVSKLKDLFTEFTFEETGLGDKIIIKAPNGIDQISVPVDTNDSEPSRRIKNFLETYSNKDLVKSMSEAKAAEEKRSEALSYTSPDDYLRQREKRNNEAFLAGIETQQKREELVESYNNAFVEIKSSKDYNPEKLASLPKNGYISRAIETSNKILSAKLDKYNDLYNEYNDLAKSGNASEDVLNEKLTELKDQQAYLKQEVAKSNMAVKAIGEAELNNSLIRESQGSTIGGLAKSFTEGLISIDRMFGVSEEENQKFLEDVIGFDTTKEYAGSEDRSDLFKAMSSVFNSFGVAAPSILTGGASSYVSAGLFFNQSYHEMKDELDQVDGMDASSKVLMSVVYGSISGALERVGLGAMLNKSGIGNKIVKATMSKALKDIPKNASKEVVELAIERSAKSIAADIFVKAGTASLTEGVTEALQYTVGEGVKEIYDQVNDVDYFKQKDFSRDVFENFYLGALAGGITNTSWSAVTRLKQEGAKALNKAETQRLFEDLRDPELLQNRKTQISEAVKAGEITKERGQELVEYYDKASAVVNKIPSDLSTSLSKKALDLIVERDEISETIEGKDANLVSKQKERINEINEQLKVLGETKEDAIQEQTTDEESEVGLQEVEQRDQEQKVVAEEEVTPSEKPASLINRPAKLTEYNGKKFDSPLEGDVYVEGQRIVFEDSSNNRVYDLGGVDDDVDFKGLQGEESRVKVTSEGKISIDNQTWNIQSELPTQGVEYNQAGEVSAVSLKEDNGNTKMFKGQDALEIAYQIELSKYQTEEQINNINELLENDEEFKEAVELSETTEVTEGETVENFEQAKKSIGNKALDILNSWENAIDDERQKRRKGANDITGIVGLATAKKIVQAMKVAVKAGMSIEQAIKKVAKEFKVKETDVVEAFDKIQNKVKETQASKAAKGISKKPTKKVTINERTALRDQIKYGQKIAREIAKNTKEGQEVARKFISDRLKGAKFTLTKTQYQRIENKVLKTKFNVASEVVRLNEYIDKAIQRAENIEIMNSAFKLKKKLSKPSKKNQDKVKAISKLLSKVDPVMVEDLDEYISLANEMYFAVKSSRVTSKELDLKQTAELDKIKKYAEDEIARQEEIKFNAFKIEFEDEIKLLKENGVISDDMSKSEMYDAISSLTQKESKDAMIEKLSGLVSDLKKGVSGMSDIDPTIKKIVNYRHGNLDLKSLVEMYEILNNYLANEVTDNSADLITRLSGLDRARKAVKAGLRFIKPKGTVLVQYDSRYSNTNILEIKLLGGDTKAKKFRDIIGLNKVKTSAQAANTILSNVIKKYDSKFSKIKNFQSIENISERGLYAQMLRDHETEFDLNKKHLIQSLESLKNSKFEKEREIGEQLEKAMKATGLYEAASIEDLKIKDFNKQAIDFWVDEFSAQFDPLERIASVVYNKDLKRSKFYTPRTMKTLGSYDNISNQLNDGLNFVDLDKIDRSMVGVLYDAKPFENLKNRYVSIDFDTNMMNQFEAALLSIHTDEAVREFYHALNSKHFEDLFEAGEVMSQMRKSYESEVNRAIGREKYEESLKPYGKLTGLLKKYSTALVLSSLKQFVTNIIPVYKAHTIHMLGRLGTKKKIKMYLALNKAQREFIDRIPYSIATRGKEAVTGLQKKTRYAKESANRVVRYIDKVSDFALEKTIGLSDRMISRVTWMNYYASELKQQGVDVDKINWETHEVNPKAAEYAEQMVNKTQNPSDDSLTSGFRNTNTGQLIHLFMPFATFTLNNAFKFRADLRTAMSSRKDVTMEDRTLAFSSLVATSAETVAFATLQNIWYSTVISALSAMGVTGDEEDEGFFDRFNKKFRDRIASQTFTELIAPLPIFTEAVSLVGDKVVGLIYENLIADKQELERIKKDAQVEKFKKTNGAEYKLTKSEQKKIEDKFYEENRVKLKYSRYYEDEVDEMLQATGKLGIVASKLWDGISFLYDNVVSDGHFDKYGNYKYNVNETDDVAYATLALKTLALTTMTADFSTFANAMEKKNRKLALSESQYKNYLEIKGRVGSAMTREDLILIKRAKEVKLTNNEIVKIIRENVNTDNKTKKYLAIIKQLQGHKEKGLR